MTPIAATLLILTLAVASVTDLKGRVIPNPLTLTAALAGLMMAAAAGLAAVSLAVVAGSAVAFPLLVISLLRPDGMGMGDAKLAGVIGIFLGWQAWPALLAGLLLASVTGLALSAAKGRPPSGMTLPLAPFLALGTLPVMAVRL